MDIRPLVTRGYDLWSPTITTASGINFGKGTLELENGWQMVAIPISKGYWDSNIHKHVHDTVTVSQFKNYVLDQIEDLYGPGIVEVSNTFTGDKKFFFSYIVGSTPETSQHNFQLVYDDNNNMEISGFWIKVVGENGPYTISWGE